MSSTKSPISSGLTNAGTHNSSTSQRSWSRTLYFRLIRAWRVGEIEFQCPLARFLISKRFELRLACSESEWSLKGNMINSEEKEMCHQERRSAWCGVRGGQGECQGDWGAPTGIEESQGDWGAPTGIEERLLYQRSTMGWYEAAPPCVIWIWWVQWLLQ